MRCASLFAVAVLALVAVALPIQSAFAALTLDISPNPVVLGGSITFSGTGATPGVQFGVSIWQASDQCAGSPQTGASGNADNSGNYQIVFDTSNPSNRIMVAGQYVARTAYPGAASPCVAFTVLPLITLAPTCGPPETTVQVTGSGFSFDASSCTITSSPSGLIGQGGQSVCVVDAGGVSGAFVVAAGARGLYDVVITPNVGQSGSAVFTTPCGFQPEPTLAPVGGVVMPANNFAIVVPWLAVCGLLGCVGTAVVVRKKHHS